MGECVNENRPSSLRSTIPRAIESFAETPAICLPLDARYISPTSYTSDSEDSVDSETDYGGYIPSSIQDLRAKRYGRPYSGVNSGRVDNAEDHDLTLPRLARDGTGRDYIDFHSSGSSGSLSVVPSTRSQETFTGCHKTPNTVQRSHIAMNTRARKTDATSNASDAEKAGRLSESTDVDPVVEQIQESVRSRPARAELADSKEDSRSSSKAIGYAIHRNIPVDCDVLDSNKIKRSLRRHGPIVNHIPQQERHTNVRRAISTIEEAFNLAPSTRSTTHAIVTTTNTLHSGSDASRLYLHCESGKNNAGSIIEHSPNADIQKLLADNAPLYATGVAVDIRLNHEHTNHEPMDGNENRGHHSHRGPSGFRRNVTSYHSGMHQQSDEPEEEDDGDQDNNRHPEEDPENLSSTGLDRQKFRCVFHHPDEPELDATGDCKNSHRYVSELRYVDLYLHFG